MLHAVIDFILVWICAIVVHEAAHAVVGRCVGMTIEGYNFFCQTKNGRRSILGGRVLFEHNGLSLGLGVLSGGCVKFSYRSDTSALSHTAVNLAGPLANAILAIIFGLQGETMMMMVNLFSLGCGCESDLGATVDLWVASARHNVAAKMLAYACVSLPVVAISVALGGWYYAVAVYVALSLVGSLLVARELPKADVAKAGA